MPSTWACDVDAAPLSNARMESPPVSVSGAVLSDNWTPPSSGRLPLRPRHGSAFRGMIMPARASRNRHGRWGGRWYNAGVRAARVTVQSSWRIACVPGTVAFKLGNFGSCASWVLRKSCSQTAIFWDMRCLWSPAVSSFAERSQGQNSTNVRERQVSQSSSGEAAARALSIQGLALSLNSYLPGPGCHRI